VDSIKSLTNYLHLSPSSWISVPVTHFTITPTPLALQSESRSNMVAFTTFRTSALLAAFASLIVAQTPAGFSPAAINNQSLSVSFGTNNVSPAGELIPRPGWSTYFHSNANTSDNPPETASPPTLSSPLSPSASGVLFMIDQDE
jgi:hypothetical protein